MLKAMTNSLLAIGNRHCQLTVFQTRNDILGDRFSQTHTTLCPLYGIWRLTALSPERLAYARSPPLDSPHPLQGKLPFARVQA